jgi:hypothetical protein
VDRASFRQITYRQADADDVHRAALNLWLNRLITARGGGCGPNASCAAAVANLPWRDCRLASPRNQSPRRCASPPALPPIARIEVVIGMRTWVRRPPLENCQDMRVRGLVESAPR